MTGAVTITAATVDPALLDLPWDLPLELWPEETIAALPKGISRHVVRLVHLSDYVVAIKETTAEMATREYEMLRALERLDVPCVRRVAAIDAAPPAQQRRRIGSTRRPRGCLTHRARPQSAERRRDPGT